MEQNLKEEKQKAMILEKNKSKVRKCQQTALDLNQANQAKKQQIKKEQSKSFNPGFQLLESQTKDEEAQVKPMSAKQTASLKRIIKKRDSIDSNALLAYGDQEIKYLFQNSKLDFCSHEFFNKMKLSSRYTNILCEIIYEAYDDELNLNRNRLEYAI